MSELTTIPTFILVDPLTGKVRPELAWMLDRFGMEPALNAIDGVVRALRVRQPCPICWTSPRRDRRRKVQLAWPCGHRLPTFPESTIVLGRTEIARLERQAKRIPKPARQPKELEIKLPPGRQLTLREMWEFFKHMHQHAGPPREDPIHVEARKRTTAAVRAAFPLVEEPDHVRTAIQRFGNVYVGTALPKTTDRPVWSEPRKRPPRKKRRTR